MEEERGGKEGSERFAAAGAQPRRPVPALQQTMAQPARPEGECKEWERLGCS